MTKTTREKHRMLLGDYIDDTSQRSDWQLTPDNVRQTLDAM